MGGPKGKLEQAGLFAAHSHHLAPHTLAISESTAERYTLADPDVRLMLLVRDDDAQAFEELMLRYQNRLVSLLAHMVGQPDLAEDLAQDVFLRVYRARKRYVPGAKFSTWLFTIAGNVAANALRTRARRHEVHLAPAANDTSTLPIEAVARRRQRPDADPATRQGRAPRRRAAGDRRARRSAADGRAAVEVRTLQLRRNRRDHGALAGSREVAAVAGPLPIARST